MDDDFTTSFEDQDDGDSLGRVGPKSGITISRAQICMLFFKHLSQQVKVIKYLNRGYNNRLYVVRTEEGSEFILKVGGRYWKRSKTETEVVGLTLVRALTTVPVPRVYIWNSDTAECGVEYLVLEKLPGLPLDVVWDGLESKQRLDILSQLASHMIQVKTSSSIKEYLSSRSNLIGNFLMTDPKDVLGSFEITRCHDSGLGPFGTFREFFASVFSEKVVSLERNLDGLFPTHQHLLPHLRKLLEELKAGNSRITDSSSDDFVFTHGDFSKANVMVVIPPPNSDLPVHVSGILDWEWCGLQVPEEEFIGCDFLRLASDPDEEANDPVLESYFYELLEKGGVFTPRTIPHMSQRRALTLIRDGVAPWYLTEVREKKSERTKQLVKEAEEQILKGLSALDL